MRRARHVLPYILALAIVALLLWQIDPVLVVHLLRRADPYWLAAGLACYILTNILRAYRFGVLLDLKQGHNPGPQSAEPRSAGRGLRSVLAPLRILPEMFALSLFNNILPSRSGELSFPYFMRRRHDMPVGESTAALLVVRMFDYAAVAALYCLLAWLYLPSLAVDAVAVVRVVAILLLASLVVLLAMPWLGRQALRAVHGLAQRLGIAELRISVLLLDVGERAVEALQRMRTPRRYLGTLGWSILVWLATFAWFAAFLEAIGLGMDYPLVIVGATFAMLAKAVPLITVGGFGAHEAGWAVGFGLVGMSGELAIASGFAVNILTLLASVICGGLALLFMWVQNRRATGPGSQGAEAWPSSEAEMLP